MSEIKSSAIVTVLDQHYAKASYHPDSGVGVIIWKSHCNSENYRKTFQTLLDFQRSNPGGVDYFLSDIREQGVVSPDDRKWFETVALPTAKGQGLKRAATVISGNVFKQYYVNILLSTAKNFGFPLKVFHRWEEAVAWLLEDDNAQIKHEDCK